MSNAKEAKAEMSTAEMLELVQTLLSDMNDIYPHCQRSKKPGFITGKRTLENILKNLQNNKGMMITLIDDLESIKELSSSKVAKPDVVYYCPTEGMNRIREEMIAKRRDSLEDLCFVIGVRLPMPDSFVLTSVLKPQMQHRRVASAKAKPMAVYQSLKYTAKYGQSIVLMPHCHPGKGVEAIDPSSIDIRTYSTWEREYPLIGVIFDEVGKFFQFFSATNKNFEIRMIGEGVNHVRDNIYCFSE